MNLKDSFHPYAIITILCWSLAYILTRLTLQHFSVFSLGFLRYLIASCILILVAIFIKIKTIPHTKDIPLFIASGCSGFFLYMIAFNQGQAVVTAATASIIIATVPVITAVLAQCVYNEKIKTFQWIAMVIEFIGVAILTMMNNTLHANHGILWLLTAALLLSIYNILQRKLTQKYTSLQVCAYSIFCGTILLAIFAPASAKELSHAPVIQIFYLMVLGIFSSTIAYIAWTKAFSKAKQTSDVSNYMFVTPFMTAIMGFLFLGETLDRATIIGGSIILVGLLLFNFGEKLKL